MIDVLCYIAGLVSGVAITRYMMGLTTKLVYQIREDMPLDEKNASPVSQSYTEDELEKE